MSKKPTRSELKRAAIVQAAKDAFQAHGVQGTSMDMLASLAEVSKRTVYNHFASKEALIMHLITELWQQATAPSAHDFDPTVSLQQQFSRVLRAEIEVIGSQSYIELNRVALGHFFYQPDALQQEVEKFTAYETASERWISVAANAGCLKPLDVKIASGQVHHLLKGGCFWMQVMQLAPVLSEQEQIALAERTAALFLSYYGKENPIVL